MSKQNYNGNNEALTKRTIIITHPLCKDKCKECRD